ncbi:Ig-like domain-containing protein [Arthrobacter tecti]
MAGLLVALFAATALPLINPAPADAAVVRPFEPVFSANTNGAIQIRGNSNMTCLTSAAGCTAARAGTGTVLNNNNFSMVFTDIDTTGSTFNSSNAQIAMPDSSNVLFAGLYWSGSLTTPSGGTAPPNATLFNQVQLQTPAQGYSTVAAAETSRLSNGAYYAFADVTSAVAAAGSGTYQVANIQAARGVDQYAGWSLVVAYGNPGEPMRNLTVFDGFGSVSGTEVVTIPVSGFQTPPSGQVRTRVGSVTFEGDRGFVGDQLQLNGQNLTNAANPAANTFNSTVSEDGSLITTRNPNYVNNMGSDADRFDATGILGNSATSATLRLTTNGDTYYPAVTTFSTELYAPKLSTDKSSEDLNGGVLEPGDIIEYTLATVNDGQDAATLSRMVDAIPVNTTYVPGSMTLNGQPLTDADGDDTGVLRTGTDENRIRVNLGQGATATSGGRVGVGQTATVTYRAQVNPDVLDDVDIVNVALTDYTGAQTGLAFSTSSNITRDPVTAPRSDLRIRKVAATDVVQRGDDAGYQIRVINDGPKAATGVIVTDTLPGGMTPETVTPTQGTCIIAAQVITCQLGQLAVGDTAVVNIVASTSDTTEDPAVNEATVTSDTTEPNPGNNTATASIAVNQAPITSPDSATTNTDEAVTVNVAANDVDADGDALNVIEALVEPPQHGTVTVNPDGTLTYRPFPGYAGTDTVTYTVSDGRGGLAQGTLGITVNNAPPVGVDDEASTTTGTPVTIGVLANDTDPNIPGTDQTLSVSEVSTPANGTAAVNADGTITYTPNASFSGTDTFTYTVSDSAGGTDTVTVSVFVPDAVPVAADDSATTPYNTVVDVDVLANDTDNNGQPLSIVAGSLTVPTDADGQIRGSAEIVDGQVRYTPPAGFSGAVTFDYTVTDGMGGTSTDVGMVSIVVENAPPTAENDLATTETDTPVTIDVLANDTDPNGTTLQIVGTGTAEDGRVTVEPDGTVTYYAPNPGFKGTDTFTYMVSDGNGGTDEGTVTVTVKNAAPTVTNERRSTPGGTAVGVPVLINDTDPNGDPLAIADFQATTPNGTITQQGDELIYTPAAGFQGTDTFTYTVSDGDGGTTEGTVTIEVVNTTPVANDDSASAMAEPGGSITLDALADDTDANGDPLTITGVTRGIGGTVAVVDGRLVYTYFDDFAGVDAFTYSISDGRGGASTTTVTVTVLNGNPITQADSASTTRGTPVTVDALANDTDPNDDAISLTFVQQPANGTAEVVDGQVRYTPAADFSGTDTVTYRVSDARGGVSTGTITVTVNNQGPDAVDDTAPTDAGEAVTVDVLANDSDPEGDSLAITTTSIPANGTVEINADGTLTYLPANGYAGEDSFTYTVSDGNGGSDTATVRVTTGNAAPLANRDEAGTASDTPVTVDVLANDTDANIPRTNQALTVTEVTQPTTGGTARIADNGTGVVFDPAPGFAGTATFSYTVDDGAGGTDTATVTVTVSNAAPVAADDAATTPYNTWVSVPVLLNDFDPNADPLTIEELTQPAVGTATIEGGDIEFTPPVGFSGTVTLDYTIDDGTSDRDTATLTITVGNAAPVAGNDTATTGRQGSVSIDVLANDTDPNPDDALRIVGVEGTDSVQGTATVDDGGTPDDPSDDRVVFTPNPGFAGTATFTYIIDDGAGTQSRAQVAVTVTNAEPAAELDATSTEWNTPVVVDVLANDNDADGDQLALTNVGQPTRGAVAINADGTLTYTPDSNWTGTDTFTYTVTDTHGGTSTATVTVEVGNARPVAVDDGAGTGADTPVTIDVLANDTDPNIPGTGQRLTVTSVTQPEAGAGTASLVPGGSAIMFTPAAGFSGTAVFTYTVSDGAGGENTAAVAVTVSDAAPVAVDDFASTPYLAPVDVEVLGNDFDPNGDALTITSVEQPDQGSAEIVDGTVRYTPPAGFSGTAIFTYTVEDGQGGTDTGTVTVTVGNASPVAEEDAAETDRQQPVSIDVLINDSDPNPSDTLTIVGIQGLDPAQGSASLNDAGTPEDPSDDRIVFTPNPDFAGVATFTYVVRDSAGQETSGKVAVTVRNAGPTAADDIATVEYGTPNVPLYVLDNDGDPEGDRLTIAGTGTAQHGSVTIDDRGLLIYTPDSGWAGSDEFTYTVSDGHGGTAEATVTVIVSNAPPIAVDDRAGSTQGEPVSISVLGNDADPNISVTGQTLSLVGFGQPQPGAGTVTQDGENLVFAPAEGFKGVATFEYTVSDGAGGLAVGTVQVIVDNDQPVATHDRADTPFNTPVEIDVLANDTDPNGDSLTISGVDEPQQGSAEVVDGRIRYSPPAGFTGTVMFTYTITDGDGGTSTATVTVIVGNAAPSAQDDSAQTERATAVRIDVLGNDSDPDGGGLAIVGTSDPANGRVVLNDDGTLTYIPANAFAGEDSFTYTISDGEGGTVTATVTVTVLNNAPDFADVPVNEQQNVQVGMPLQPLEVSDPDGDRVTVQQVAGELPPGISLNPDGSFTGAATTPGTYTFSVQACDDRQPDPACTSQTVTVVVTEEPVTPPQIDPPGDDDGAPGPGSPGDPRDPGDPGNPGDPDGPRKPGDLMDDRFPDTGAPAGVIAVALSGLLAIALGAVVLLRNRSVRDH